MVACPALYDTFTYPLDLLSAFGFAPLYFYFFVLFYLDLFLLYAMAASLPIHLAAHKVDPKLVESIVAKGIDTLTLFASSVDDRTELHDAYLKDTEFEGNFLQHAALKSAWRAAEAIAESGLRDGSSTEHSSLEDLDAPLPPGPADGPRGLLHAHLRLAPAPCGRHRVR